MARNTFQYPGLQPNARYAIQLRGVDANGNPGRWSTTFEFETVQDLIAPGQVEGLTAVVDGSNFVINWDVVSLNEDGSLMEDFRDYIVTITGGVQSVEFPLIDNKLVFTYTMNKSAFGGAPQPNLTVKVEARDRVGNRGAPAEVVVVKPAPAPSALAAIAKRNGVELIWTEVEDDLDRYELWKNGVFYARISAGTLIYTDTDVGEGPQEYRIRAYDRFEQFSESNLVLEGEISLDLTDTVGPKPPTLPEYEEIEVGQTVLANVSWLAPVEDTDDTSYTDHESFQLRYRKDTSRPWTNETVPDTRALGTDNQRFDVDLGIEPGGTLYWEVRAVDRSGNASSWLQNASPVSVDESVPNKPSVPVIAGNLQTIQVRHNLRDEFGNPLPLNVQRLDIHIGTTAGFIPDETNRIGRASVNRLIRMGPLELVWSAPHEVTESNQDRYVKVVAVTSFPKYSDPSNPAGPETIDLVQSIHIEDATITDAKIANLDANKLTAGSAFINDLAIESKITVNPVGSIESTNFDFNARTGWSLDDGNLYLFDGEIDAGLIVLQNEANLLDHGHTMFSYDEAWYSQNIHTASTSIFATITSLWSRYSSTALRIQTTSATSGNQVWLSDSNFGKDIRVENSSTYIFSAYVYNNAATSKQIGLMANEDQWDWVNGVGGTQHVGPGETLRISGTYTPIGDRVVLGFDAFESGCDFIVDGVQFERQTGSSTEPSAFKPGGITTISAGQLSTGQIDANVINVINLNASNITAGFIDAARIESRSIVADKIAVGTITAASAVIADAAIQRAQIQDGEIVRAKIGDAAIGRAQIEDAEVTFAKIDSAAINSLRAHTVSADNITAGTITAEISMNSANIFGGSIEAGLLTTGSVFTATNTRVYGQRFHRASSGTDSIGFDFSSATGWYVDLVSAGAPRANGVVIGTVGFGGNHNHNTGTRTSSGASWFSGGTTGATGNPLNNTSSTVSTQGASAGTAHTHRYSHSHNVQDHTHTLVI